MMAAALQKTLGALLAVGSPNHKELIEKLRGVLEQIIALKDEERITGTVEPIFEGGGGRMQVSTNVRN